MLVLYEKTEGVLQALVVSPLDDVGYLVSKAVSLSGLAVATSFAVAVTEFGLSSRIAVLLSGVFLSSSLIVFLGFVAVSRFDSINEYFLSAAVWGAVLFSPILGYLDLFETPAFYLSPVRPLLITIGAGVRPTPLWEVVYAFAYLSVGTALAFLWARRSFDRDVLRQGTPGRKLGSGSTRGTRTDRWRPVPQSPWVGLLVTDVKNWIRDPMLAFAAVGPLVLATVVRVIAPVVTTRLTEVIDLAAYYPVIAGSMAVFGPGIFGFIVGMLVLEDRDTDVLAAYRTSPLSLNGYLLYRGGTASLFSVLSTLPALLVVGLVRPSIPTLVGSAILGALSGSVIGLVLGLTASNSIEGIALSKFMNVALLGPALVIATVPEPLQFLAGIVPMYWPVKVYVAGATGQSNTLPLFGIGIGVHLIALVCVTKIVVPRTID
ncbi:MAG: ABC transporter [Halosimplex sp.]